MDYLVNNNFWNDVAQEQYEKGIINAPHYKYVWCDVGCCLPISDLSMNGSRSKSAYFFSTSTLASKQKIPLWELEEKAEEGGIDLLYFGFSWWKNWKHKLREDAIRVQAKKSLERHKEEWPEMLRRQHERITRVDAFGCKIEC